jgi:ATP-dependent RNA helicase DeaD
MPNPIKKLASKYMKEDYQHISIEEISKTSINVKQYYYLVNEKTRVEAMCRVLDSKDFNSAIIFCQTKREVDEVYAELSKRNYSAEAMHGDIAQSSRIKTLERFKKGSFKYLIATDVAARGIHVENIECVINYNLPQDIESYIHRIGRTGRVENEGVAISFVNHREVKFLSDVEKVAKCTIRKSELPQTTEIVNKKYEKIINQVNTAISNKEHEEYIGYVRDMNKDELIKFSAGLFKALFDKEVGSDLNKDLTVASPRNQTNKSYTRVFLTIGKMDNLKKGSLLDFLKDTTGIDKALFMNIEILTKFTFMDVHTSVIDEFIKKVNNTKLYERVIRVEKAKAR